MCFLFTRFCELPFISCSPFAREHTQTNACGQTGTNPTTRSSIRQRIHRRCVPLAVRTFSSLARDYQTAALSCLRSASTSVKPLWANLMGRKLELPTLLLVHVGISASQSGALWPGSCCRRRPSVPIRRDLVSERGGRVSTYSAGLTVS